MDTLEQELGAMREQLLMRPCDDNVADVMEKILHNVHMIRAQAPNIYDLKPLPSDVYLDIHEDVDFDVILKDSPKFSCFPARGIFYSYTFRVCFVLHCSTRFKSDVPVVFIVDTGSRNTHMTEKTIESLGVRVADVAYPCVVNIAGKMAKVHQSIAHFKHANILGQDYLMIHGMTLQIDYKSKQVLLKE